MSTAAVNDSATADTRPPKVQRQVLVALSGLLSALFVATLSSTVVSTALPRMIGALHGTQTQYTWVVTATLLSTTATTPIWGKLADLCGVPGWPGCSGGRRGPHRRRHGDREEGR